jgi:hypothetical protein
MASIESLMKRYFVLHARMQMLLHDWNEADVAQYGEGWTNIIAVEALRRLQAELGGPTMDDDTLRAKLESNLALIERFAQAVQDLALETDASLGRYVTPSSPGAERFDLSALNVMRRSVLVGD